MLWQTKSSQVWADKFIDLRVMEVDISKINNVASISKQMKVKVKYVQRYLYIVICGFYRGCQAAIPICDILIGSRVMAERLNPYVGIFHF